MKKILFIIILSLLIIPYTLVAADTGTLAGKVTVEKTKEPLRAANVVVEGTEMGALTKSDGSFIIKNIPVGVYDVSARIMGYEKQTKEVEIKADLTTTVMFSLRMKAIGIPGITVTATRAIKRETPIAFTDLAQETISNVYTTDDMPQLLIGVPGLFSTTGGLGEGELRLRGFDQDKVQILINGIPVNDPESQQVYWSNWTGLSSNVKSVQVQRGAASSLYGSGVFGGSINIETIGVGPDAEKEWSFRTSVGGYHTVKPVADGKGNKVLFNPINYNLLLRYNSGLLKGGRFNYNVMVERKVGDSYQIGTFYDGWSFGAEVQNIWGDHKVNTSLIIAPQLHNQARATTDMALQEKLGRNYNRNNNPEQENYYNKPQLSIRDEWNISDNSLLLTNFFFSRGDGGGKYLKNDKFDVNTGLVYYMPLSAYTDNKYFGRHARHIYETTGLVLTGYDPVNLTYTSPGYDSVYVSKARNLPNKDYSHSWENDSQNHHKQFGLNTYFDHKFSDMFKLIVGGEWRRWKALHVAKSWNFRYNEGNYLQAQDRYNYDGIVTNMSGFVRALIKPIPSLNILVDGQYASYTSEVEELPIQIFDYGQGNFTDEYYYATKELKNDDGSLKFTDDDYKKTFNFFSPKFGVNYNITEYLNLLANYSIAKKEPRLTDWYSRSGGPDDYQTWTDTAGVVHVEELDPEKATTVEFGVGYEGVGWNANANYYITDYEDKLESTYLLEGEYITINAGNARHQGLELAANFVYGNIDGAISGTYAQNRWTEMTVEKIFGEPDSLIVDKVVPYSPEQMVSGSIGYTFHDMPLNGKLRIGFSGNWWDEYYGSYTNTYKLIDGTEVEAKLPYYLSINTDFTYSFKLGGKNASIRLDLKNINNRDDNYLRAYYGTDYGRDDNLVGDKYMYVQPAPKFNAFITAEVNF